MEKSDEDSLYKGYQEDSDVESEEQYKPPKLTAIYQEFLHDMSYDYYGHRLVTCGADQKLKIWKKMKQDKCDDDQSPLGSPTNRQGKQFNEFEHCASPILKKNISRTGFEQSMYLVDEWEAHSGPIFKVVFAHPQYGQVFASWTESSEVFIWEEKLIRKPGTSHELIKEWTNVASIKVTKDKIQDIWFSPEHCGLKLLVLYKKGNIAIYQAKMVSKLNKWQLICDLNCVNLNGCNSVDWLPDENFDVFAVASNTSSKESNEVEDKSIKEETKDTFDMLPESTKVIQFYASTDSDIYAKCEPEYKHIHKGNKSEAKESNPLADMASILSIKFAPCYGRSYALMATWDINYRIDFWRINLSKHKDSQNSLIPSRFNTSIRIEFSYTRNLELYNLLSADMGNKFTNFGGQVGFVLDFESSQNKYSEAFLWWNPTGTMLAVSSGAEKISVFKQEKISKKDGVKFKMIANFAN